MIVFYVPAASAVHKFNVLKTSLGASWASDISHALRAMGCSTSVWFVPGTEG